MNIILFGLGIMFWVGLVTIILGFIVLITKKCVLRHYWETSTDDEEYGRYVTCSRCHKRKKISTGKREKIHEYN